MYATAIAATWYMHNVIPFSQALFYRTKQEVIYPAVREKERFEKNYVQKHTL